MWRLYLKRVNERTFLRFEVAKFLEREREKKAGISCEIALISESHSIAKRIAE